MQAHPLTTDNLQTLFTKDDAKNFATKDDLKKFATKTELKSVEKVLRTDILRLEERVENLEEGQERIEGKLDKLINTADAFVGKVEKLETENEIGMLNFKILIIE